MRDPQRIEEITNVLKEKWSQVSDWRFGQFLYNFLTSIPYEGDIFFPEDDKWLEWLKNYKFK